MRNKISTIKEHLLTITFILALSGIAGIFAVGFGYDPEFKPGDYSARMTGISSDGWIQSYSKIILDDLGARGNQLLLNFRSARPASAGPAKMEVSICNKPLATLEVGPSSLTHRLAVPNSCEPREYSFNVINPWTPSSKDRRALGAVLSSARVTSRIGVPILNLGEILKGTGALFIVSFLAYLITLKTRLPRALRPLPAIVLLVCGGVLLASADGIQHLRAYALWLLTVFTLLGACIAAYFLRDESKGGTDTVAYSSPFGNASPLPALVVFLFVLAGALLRFYGIGFGLPANYHPDEVPKLNAIMRMVDSQSLNPKYFLHPSLLLYLTYLINTIFHYIGMEGSFRETGFLAGRTVSAVAGSFSIYLLFLVGRRTFGTFAGVVAAAIFAFAPLHVTCSRYMKEDVLMTFFTLAVVLAVLKAVQEDRKFFLWVAAFFCGVTASSKYTGLLTITILASAPWLKSNSWWPDYGWVKTTFFAVFLVPIGFIICTPYSILDFPSFYRGFSSEQAHMQRGHGVPIDAWSQFWMFHFWRSVIPGMSVWTTLIALVGAGALLWRRRKEDLFVVAMVLLFYLPSEFVKAKPPPQPERYMVPVIPFLALCAAAILQTLSLTRMRILALLGVALAILVPANRSIGLASELNDDTRDQMGRWMIANLPRGAKVLGDYQRYQPDFFDGEFQLEYPGGGDLFELLVTESAKKSEYDYMLLSNFAYERHMSLPIVNRAARVLLRNVFKTFPILVQFQAKNGPYGFNNPTVTLFSLKDEDFAKLEAEIKLKEEGKISMTSNEVKNKEKFLPW